MNKLKIISASQTVNSKRATETTKIASQTNTKKNETALSKAIWDLGLNGEPNVSWTIVEKCNKLAAGMKMCNLCLCEKKHILNASNDKNNINKKSEAVSLCLHRNKFKLSNLKME